MRKGHFALLFTTFFFFCCLALWLTLLLWYGGALSKAEVILHWQWFVPLFFLWALTQYIFGLFEVRVYKKLGEFVRFLLASWVCALVLGVLYFYTQPDLLITPRRFLLAVAVSSFLLFGFFGYFLVKLFGSFSTRTVYFLGEDKEEEAIVLNSAPLGQFTFGGRWAFSDQSSLPALVVVSQTYKPDGEALRVLVSARRKGFQFIFLSDWIELVERKVLLSGIDDFWILSFGGGRRKFYDRIKRLVDVCVGFVGTVVLLLLYAPIALLIKMTSSGPVLFRQDRIGFVGKVFSVVKFRTMRVNLGNTWTNSKDLRVTWIGRFLRRWRLDELPQFWNILKGEMSLVGPRPEQVKIVEMLCKEIPFYEERHEVLPGLTGWAQLHVYASTIEESKTKLEYDLYYVKYRSLWFDVEIILKTLSAILFRAGR